MHRLRRHRIDTLSSESEDKLYDINKELVENLENLEEISDHSEIAKDIINLNQTLLTGNRNIEYLDKLRKAKFQNGFYDNLEALIKIEQNINRLEDFFRDEIDKLDEIYLVPPKDKKSLHNLREHRINDLQNPNPKRPAPEDNQEEMMLPSRNTNNANPIRNKDGTLATQINFIINEYKKTIDDNRRRITRTQTNKMRNKIQEAYKKAKDGKTLLDILYYNLVLDKDDQFLLAKKYTVKKITEAKNLANDINKLLYSIKKKKINQPIEFTRLKKNNKNPAPKSRLIFMVKPENFDWFNPFYEHREIIDRINSINYTMKVYKDFLLDPFSITPDNINRIHDALLDKFNTLKGEDIQKKFLDDVTTFLCSESTTVEEYLNDTFDFDFAF